MFFLWTLTFSLPTFSYLNGPGNGILAALTSRGFSCHTTALRVLQQKLWSPGGKTDGQHALCMVSDWWSGSFGLFLSIQLGIPSGPNWRVLHDFSEGCSSTTNQLGLEMGMMGMLPWHSVNGFHDDQPVHGMGATMFSEKPSFIKSV